MTCACSSEYGTLRHCNESFLYMYNKIPARCVSKHHRFKLGGIVHNWKRRWFMMTDKTISYSADETTQDIIETIPLSQVLRRHSSAVKTGRKYLQAISEKKSARLDVTSFRHTPFTIVLADPLLRSSRFCQYSYPHASILTLSFRISFAYTEKTPGIASAGGNRHRRLVVPRKHFLCHHARSALCLFGGQPQGEGRVDATDRRVPRFVVIVMAANVYLMFVIPFYS